MSFKLVNRVKQITTTEGSGIYTLSGSAPAGFQDFTTALLTGDVTYYLVEDGTDWEAGIGTFTTIGLTLSRDTIFASSNGGSAVVWGAGTRNVMITLPGEAVSSLLDTTSNGILVQTTARTYSRRTITVSGPGIAIANGNGISGNPAITLSVIPSGTKMIFQQATAPSGWTQDTTGMDQVLRVVAGTGDGTGGANDVSGGSANTAATSHNHADTFVNVAVSTHTHSGGSLQTTVQGLVTTHSTVGGNPTTPPAHSHGMASGVTGAGGDHNHTINGSVTAESAHVHSHTPNIKFRNVIACTKDA